jgi:hypothetical protein
MPDENPFRDDALESVRGLIAEAEVRVEELRAEVERVERTKRVWNDLLAYIEKRWFLHVQALMDRERDLLHQLREHNHPVVGHLEQIYRTARQEGMSMLKRFPSHLEVASANAGLNIDRESRHPRYSFDNKFFQLEIDDRKGTARLSDHEGRLVELPADIDAVIEAVQREHARVMERPFDSKRFLSKLRHQYLAIIAKDGLTDGDAIPIRRITARLHSNEKRFRTDEFLIDLSRLVEQGATEIDGYVLELQQTKDTSQGMLLHGAGGRGYIGYIKFRRA